MRGQVRVILSVSGSALIAWIAFGFQGSPSAASKLRSFPPVLSPALPYDIDAGTLALLRGVHPVNGGEYSPADTELVIRAQRNFDILSWQAFLALNWPHRTYAGPEPKIDASNGSPLWSFWAPMEKIFLPNGAPPAGQWAPDKEQKDFAKNGLNAVMTKAAWRQNASSDDNFQAFSGPLVDQNGKWARYEAMVNPEEFEYIRSNKLYSLDGQIAFSQNHVVDMPINAGARHGAIEIKLAWKELAATDDASRFYTAKLRVQVSAAGPPQFRDINAGLVGMHIAMHTASSPEWIWSTFEQIDNVRQNPLEHGGMSRASFMNPNTPGAPVNMLPAMNGDCTGGTCQTWYESLTTTPVQVSRVVAPTQAGLNPLDAKIADEVSALNAEVQALLKKNNSVFQYYELIGTQWPVRKDAPAFAGGQGSAPESITNKMPGDMVPVFLVNTTMETYFQKGTQNAGCLEQDDRLPNNCVADTTQVVGTESCVGCHYSAGICTGYKRNVDGTPVMVNGVKVPIYGIDGEFGRSAHGNFSWMLQIETAKQNVGPSK